MEEVVVLIRGNDLDKFQGQYAGSTGWLNIDHEWSKINVSIIEPDFYKRLFRNNIEGKDINTYKNFVVLFDITNINLSMRDYSVTQNK